MNCRQLANSRFPQSGSYLADFVHKTLHSAFCSSEAHKIVILSEAQRSRRICGCSFSFFSEAIATAHCPGSLRELDEGYTIGDSEISWTTAQSKRMAPPAAPELTTARTRSDNGRESWRK
jgi:hypothetical protein